MVLQMFTGGGLNTSSSFGATVTPSTANPMKDFEVSSPPDDSISSLAFSPSTLPQNFLIAGSWDNNVFYIFLKYLLLIYVFLVEFMLFYLLR